MAHLHLEVTLRDLHLSCQAFLDNFFHITFSTPSLNALIVKPAKAPLRALGTDPLPELRHVDRVHRRAFLEHLLTREVLHVRILHPAGENAVNKRIQITI